MLAPSPAGPSIAQQMLFMLPLSGGQIIVAIRPPYARARTHARAHTRTHLRPCSLSLLGQASGDPECRPDVYTYNKIIHLLGKARQTLPALALVNEMRCVTTSAVRANYGLPNTVRDRVALSCDRSLRCRMTELNQLHTCKR